MLAGLARILIRIVKLWFDACWLGGGQAGIDDARRNDLDS
jgi:hypothetical protein